MSTRKAFLVMLVLITYSFPSWAALELVDDFSGPTLDFTKWSEFNASVSAAEYAARIDTAADNLVLINSSDGTYYDRVRISVLNTTLTALQSTISVISVSDGSGGEASANIEGLYYNSSFVAPVDDAGAVFARVAIGDRGNGLEAWWNIFESTDPNFRTWNDVSSGTIIAPGTLNTNIPYIAKIEYDGNRTFVFTIDGTDSGPIIGPARAGPAAFSYQRLSSSTDCCGSNPSIHATFDDVVLDNGLGIYDDFSAGSYIDSSRWVHYSGARVTENSKLILDVADDDIQQTGQATTGIFLKQRNPDYVEGRILVSSDSDLANNLVGRARLTGYFYNERRDGGANAMPYDDTDGDVWGRIDIVLENNVLFANVYLESELPNFNTDRQLLFQAFNQLIAFDTEYRVSIKRDGKMLIFSLNNEQIVYNITTPTYPPSPAAGNGYRDFVARIHGTVNSDPAGASGTFKMRVDDVYTENFPNIEDDDSGDGGGGCFIATAAYGSYLDPHVITLRRFRDRYLLTNSPGEWFVGFYYRHSPPFADYIREREILRTVARSLLSLVVYSIEYPVAVVLLALLAPLIMTRRRKLRKNRI